MEGAATRAELDAFRRAASSRCMSHPPPPLVRARLTDGEVGVASVCTAHPVVIEAALLQAARSGRCA